MIEKVFKFGRSANLVGVLSEPDHSVEAKGPAVCLLNSGLLHRVGAYRSHVTMARILAASGYTVFRFDLSGIGDSDKHRDSRTYDQQILGDIEEAMDWLSAKRGFTDFVVVGLCTGADNAHKISVLDSRVVGAVMLDGYAYPCRTPKYYIHWIMRHYGYRMVRMEAWWNLLKRCFKPQKAGDNRIEYEQRSRTEDYFWSLPKKSKTLKELQRLMERDVKLLYIYSGANNGYYYDEQFFDMYRPIALKSNVEVRYFDRADHTYTLCKDRKKMIDAICSWVESSFPLGGQ